MFRFFVQRNTNEDEPEVWSVWLPFGCSIASIRKREFERKEEEGTHTVSADYYVNLFST